MTTSTSTEDGASVGPGGAVAAVELGAGIVVGGAVVVLAIGGDVDAGGSEVLEAGDVVAGSVVVVLPVRAVALDRLRGVVGWRPVGWCPAPTTPGLRTCEPVEPPPDEPPPSECDPEVLVEAPELPGATRLLEGGAALCTEALPPAPPLPENAPAAAATAAPRATAAQAPRPARVAIARPLGGRRCWARAGRDAGLPLVPTADEAIAGLPASEGR
ncbi:MAG TPA: hypothetical protein VMD59_06690 [Acidimicrobiales bacterium]|nr:hypothetical protein [Acidimicrobiales bacterium]